MHPVDRLLELRKLIKALRAEHDTLRTQIITGQCGTLGNTASAVIRRQVRVSVLPPVPPEDANVGANAGPGLRNIHLATNH